ncbi:MAG: repeat protein [Rhizobium sp.]|nr:repeat protein [Rhizobium sp.]
MTDNDVIALLTQGAALHPERKFDEAIAIYKRVLDAHPGNLDALTFLASAYRSLGRIGEAVALHDRIAETNPDRADFWFNRGNALGDSGRHADAAVAYQRSIELEPANAVVLANLAICHSKVGNAGEAIACYERALEIDPDNKISLHNIGNLLADQGRLYEAAEYFRRTVRSWPELAEGHYNLSHILLRLGDFTAGFREYEWRWDTADFFEKPAYRDVPVWKGEKLDGKRLIVHSEQGLGDSIQFAKILGMLASLGGDIVFHVPKNLERLFKTMPFAVTVTGAHRASDADFQVALLSLPHRLKLTAGSVPAASAFLTAEPAVATKWSSRLKLGSSRPSIGLVWQGNPNSPAERGRSLPSAETLAPFAALAGTRLIALQMLAAEDLEPADTPSGWRVRGLSFTLEHPGPDMDKGADSFADTAAIMAGIDQVVSVCTAPLHLAGALGRPSIALLKAVPDWRWMMERTDTPWYPTMQLVRQQRGEDYGPVVDRAVEAVRRKLDNQ